MGLKLFGKNIYQVYTHHIMRIDYDTILEKTETFKTNLTLKQIKSDNIKQELDPVGTTVTVANLQRLVRKNPSLVEGFVISDARGNSVGTIWIMYKGGNDLEYRIRDIDAYLFDVYMNEKYRGNGYAGQMIRLVMDYLKERGIDTAYLVYYVNKN